MGISCSNRLSYGDGREERVEHRSFQSTELWKQKRGEGGAPEMTEASSFQSTKLWGQRREEGGAPEMARRCQAWGASPGRVEIPLGQEARQDKGLCRGSCTRGEE